MQIASTCDTGGAVGSKGSGICLQAKNVNSKILNMKTLVRFIFKTSKHYQ